jgi:ATP-dependent DNA helicase PIF1
LAEWDEKGTHYSRKQFPLRLAWAITIHKSQGLTLEKAKIQLGESDFSAGLSFVAISRVKSLKGLMFKTGFGLNRLRRDKATDNSVMLLKDTKRLQEIGFTFDDYGTNVQGLYHFLDDD